MILQGRIYCDKENSWGRLSLLRYRDTGPNCGTDIRDQDLPRRWHAYMATVHQKRIWCSTLQVDGKGRGTRLGYISMWYRVEQLVFP